MADALPVAYLNGSYVPTLEARISPLDRAFLFGDSVYEVIPVFNGVPLLMDAHLQRLSQSLQALRISNPYSDAAWREIVHQLIARNGAGNIGVYLQISRGADIGRDHVFPARKLTPTVFGMATPIAPATPGGVAAITRPDIRWQRCDIKATALLANVLLRQDAQEHGAADAILIRDGYMTEAGASSVLIVEDNAVIVPPYGPVLLPGTTRSLTLRLIREAGIVVHQDSISESRLRKADEIWLLSATKAITPVVSLDGQPVGSGNPGPMFALVSPLLEASKSGGAPGVGLD